VRRSDMVLLIIDGTVGPTHQDARLIEMCLEHHKALVVVANKTDLGRKEHENFRDWFREKVDVEFRFFADVPVVFTSAKTGLGLDDLFRKIEDVRVKLATKITTSQLNKFFTEVIKQAPSPVYATENVKFYYLTQTQQKPPSFIAFANHPEGVTPAYRRFLIRKIQENWGLKGIPLRIFVMAKGGG
jgi:GTP-binding protein